MADLNMVALVGRLAKDAELKKVNDLWVMEFTLATNSGRKNRSTEQWESVASFISMASFGTYAEKLHPYMTKGKYVSVEGRLAQETWTKDNVTHSRLKVVPTRISFISAGKRKDNAGGDAEADAETESELPYDKEFYSGDDGGAAEEAAY